MANNISAHDKEKQLNETEERQVKVGEMTSFGKKTFRWSVWSISFITYQKHLSVRKAIPNIASAIKTVVSLSNNENFKAECFTLVKVSLQFINQ